MSGDEFLPRWPVRVTNGSRNTNIRMAVERVNSRIDVLFGFECHCIRGLKKMDLRVGLALCVMLTMALGRIREKQGENLRRLVKAS